MKILGIDYGKSKIGLAVSVNFLADPCCVLRYENEEEVLVDIVSIIKRESIEKIVIGISEGESAEATEVFGNSLKQKTDINIEYWDETLSTQEAIAKSVEAGMGREKRKNLEDAFAATIMLQSYLDTNV